MLWRWHLNDVPQNLTNVDGIALCLNLERLWLSENDITDVRAIGKHVSPHPLIVQRDA
jgi:hypothetical protein